jgi:N-acetylneuraminic acid mutarotase
MIKYFIFSFFLLGSIIACVNQEVSKLNKRQWQQEETANTCTNRHECAATAINDELYLLGGRGDKPVEKYNPQSKSWTKMVDSPIEMHHFQAITYQNEAYVLGAFTGKYPHETPIENIWIYNPIKNEWRKGPLIPKERLRGAAGVFVYQDKIYMVCGIQDGHWDGHVTWFDVFDPKTNIWSKLPEAPHARDHFQAVVIDDKLYVAGGRRSSAKTKQVFQLTEVAVDVFDFKSGKWSTLPSNLNLPTARAGCSAIGLGNQLLIIGGESSQPLAHNEVEALDIKKLKWTKLSPMVTGRHASQPVYINGKIHIAAGCSSQGGRPELNSIEVF